MVIILLTVLLNVIILRRESTIVIDKVNQIQLLNENGERYIALDDGHHKLRCNFSDIFAIWEVQVTKGEAVFEVTYSWNILNPKKGKVIRIIRQK